MIGLAVKFEWDPLKAKSNNRKHKVSFQIATTVFGDPLSITFDDPDHSAREQRLLTFGLSKAGKLLILLIQKEMNRFEL